MFRKVEQNGRIKITHHVPGDYAIEPNPKRQKIPDFKRIIVNPVVNGLKVNIVKAPDRVVKFDIVERPIGYQSMTPTPRTLTNIAPMVQVSQMLQAARIEKLQIEAPDKANVDFWKTYNEWAPGMRIPTLSQAIDDGGQVNLVPIEINPLSISKWDWAVWFLSTMVTNRLIKKYQQTTVQLLKLFFENAQFGDVAQMTAGTVNVVPGWVFDEFSIVKKACQQLELPREPEPYGFEAPFKVLPQEFANKMLEILLYLTANAISSRVEHISSYNTAPLNFTEVKTMMQDTRYRLDMKTRQIEDNPNPTTAAASASPGPTGATPLRMGPNARMWDTPGFDRRTGAPRDFYAWESPLAEIYFKLRQDWPDDYEARNEMRENVDQGYDLWYATLFELRNHPVDYFEAVGRDGILSMRDKMKTTFQALQRDSVEMMHLTIALTLHGSQDSPPLAVTGQVWQPLSVSYLKRKLSKMTRSDYNHFLVWINVFKNIFDENGTSGYDRMMQAINERDRQRLQDDGPEGARDSIDSQEAVNRDVFESPMGRSIVQREQYRGRESQDRGRESQNRGEDSPPPTGRRQLTFDDVGGAAY